MFLLVSEKLKIIICALGGLNLTGVCHFSNRRDVCGDSFHGLRSPGGFRGGNENFMRDRCKLSFSRPVARAFSQSSLRSPK